MADEDPYFVLGLDPRADLTDGEIKKAYRKKALVLHPDKRKDSEREVAQREFDALQKAYDILLDPAARKALEDLAKARAATRARCDAQDLKRRKLREDLERRERVAAVGKTEEEEAQERLQKELVRLRRDFAVRKKGFDNGRLGGERNERCGTGNSTDGNPSSSKENEKHKTETQNIPTSVPEHLLRAVKVTWRSEVSNYPVQKLREVYGKHGEIEDVVIRDSKKLKSKKSALLVFRDVGGAQRAANAVNGDKANPLVTVRAVNGTAGGTVNGTTSTAHQSSEPETVPKSSSTSDAKTPGSGTTPAAPTAEPFPHDSQGNPVNRDYESVVLDRMRRAQEKARIIAQMEAEDAVDGEYVARY